MRIRWLLLALALGSSPGCSLFVTAARDVSYEVKLKVQECLEEHRNVKTAEDSWKQTCAGKPLSRDYERGYKDGFADYLRAGGTGLPPPTPEGHQAIEQWYAGYREGSAAAQASGLRRLVLVPTHANLLPASPPPLPPPPPPTLPAPPSMPAVQMEQLPNPRVLPSAEPIPAAVPTRQAPIPPVPPADEPPPAIELPPVPVPTTQAPVVAPRAAELVTAPVPPQQNISAPPETEWRAVPSHVPVNSSVPVSRQCVPGAPPQQWWRSSTTGL
jgi:hypothetical protein